MRMQHRNLKRTCMVAAGALVVLAVLAVRPVPILAEGALRATAVGQSVILKYPDYWTPLDPSSATRHVSKVDFGDVVLFDETRR